MKKVYIESSVISYITAKPSRDLIVLARQALTLEWWESKRNKYDICISELVLQEIASGDPVAAQKRLDVVRDVQNLEITLAAKELASILVSEGAVPNNSLEDALHISTVAVQGVEYLLTWNFKHINNASTRAIITHVIENFGYISPILCSPEEL
ncbi:MAG: type II toxin-antitoxin system VapC family toxin [gamma proteobacterium symbiont of Taylorina sp.]|nr:type II toxin-antitoxin system VapC family toxin [gamma proteobacterium symbiont of Taylorina sp.]